MKKNKWLLNTLVILSEFVGIVVLIEELSWILVLLLPEMSKKQWITFGITSEIIICVAFTLWLLYKLCLIIFNMRNSYIGQGRVFWNKLLNIFSYRKLFILVFLLTFQGFSYTLGKFSEDLDHAFKVLLSYTLLFLFLKFMVTVNKELISDTVFSNTYRGDINKNYFPNPKYFLSEYGVIQYKELMSTGVLYDSYFEQPSKGAVTVKIKRVLIPLSRSYFIGADFQVVILNSKYTQFLFLFRKFILFFKTIFNVIKYRSVSKAFYEYNTLKNTMSDMDKHFWSQLSIILSLIIYQFFAYGLS